MKVFWLQQTEADVPTVDNWLSATEARRLSSLHFPKRYADWRLGRWTAKCAVAAYLGRSVTSHLLYDIEIRPALSGAPEVSLAGQPAALTISLSHRDGAAMAAIASAGTTMGCDLELIEPHSNAFIGDYFTPGEQALVARTPGRDQAALVALLWSAKESALKAVGQGLRLDTRSMLVSMADNFGLAEHDRETPAESAAAYGKGWHTLQVRHTDTGRTLHGCWQRTGKLLRTLVTDLPLFAPILLVPQL